MNIRSSCIYESKANRGYAPAKYELNIARKRTTFIRLPSANAVEEFLKTAKDLSAQRHWANQPYVKTNLLAHAISSSLSEWPKLSYTLTVTSAFISVKMLAEACARSTGTCISGLLVPMNIGV